jgi:anti-anti-sigma factor
VEAGRFTIVSSDADASLVRLEGEFDEAEALGRTLSDLATRSRTVDLDLGAVTFFGSRGLGALTSAQEVAVAGGGSLRIVASSPRVTRLLELTDLHRLFGVRGEGGVTPRQPKPGQRE